MLLPQEIIRRKRDGHLLSRDEIADFIGGVTAGRVSAEQAAAFAMAVFLRGMDFAEAAHLTRAMADSGHRLDWSEHDLPGPVLDKHSTGGVGDNVSLVLAPLLAACGAFVPMIAGRGLGHTGGTLDKLDAIPGYRTQPTLAAFQDAVRMCGCAIVGQTDDLAPADRRLYAIRDVTGTVESAPLITASILSKKLAAGLDALVMDVKCGSGAFMVTRDEARALARSLVETGTAAGLPTTALITDMDRPLASCAGNAVEVGHAIAHLTGAAREPRFLDVTLALAAELLLRGRLASGEADAREKAENALASGRAAERFARMCAALGGPHDIIERPEAYLPAAPAFRDVYADRSGVVAAINTRALGLAVITLGGGRRQASDTVDGAVGLTALADIGDATDKPLALIHACDGESAQRAATLVRNAYTIADVAPPVRHAVLERVESHPA